MACLALPFLPHFAPIAALISRPYYLGSPDVLELPFRRKCRSAISHMKHNGNYEEEADGDHRHRHHHLQTITITITIMTVDGDGNGDGR